MMHSKTVAALFAASVLLAGCSSGHGGSSSADTSSQASADADGSATLPSDATGKPLVFQVDLEKKGSIVVPGEAERWGDKIVSGDYGQIQLVARWVGTSGTLSYIGFDPYMGLTKSDLPAGVDPDATYQSAPGTVFMSWYLATTVSGSGDQVTMQLSVGDANYPVTFRRDSNDGDSVVVFMQLPGTLTSGKPSGVPKVVLNSADGKQVLVLYPGS